MIKRTSRFTFTYFHSPRIQLETLRSEGSLRLREPSAMKPYPLDDPRWSQMLGGYRVPYDPSPALALLRSGSESEVAQAWKELSNELHHQGNIGEASYAAVIAMVHICIELQRADWNLFAIAACIQNCRRQADNAPVPADLMSDYDDAWAALFEFGLQCIRTSGDPLLVRSVLSIIATYKGLEQLGELLAFLDESEIEELHQQYIGG